MSRAPADIRPGRLTPAEIASNFEDIHPPLSRSEALIAADRCYFCFDAPCTTACPTGIDIPGFIQKIRSDNIKGSARTILQENILGGMCARVCPTEILCEEACVRNTHEDKPVDIGLLQRYATDPIIAGNVQLFEKAPSSGKSVAVVGAGPAGLSCAHRLAMLGHSVVLFCRDAKPGGLSEYGIAAYKTVDNFAQREVDYILGLGNIEVRKGVALNRDVDLDTLRDQFGAVFLAIGLEGVNALGIADEDANGVLDAVDYIARLRQTTNKESLPVGRRVVVIGGGMTAIDIAVQSKRLGAERVDIVYRRGPAQMGASAEEQAFAQTNGVSIRHFAAPKKILVDGGVTGIEFSRTELDKHGNLRVTEDTWSIDADMIFKAVGQTLAESIGSDGKERPELCRGKLQVDAEGKTSLSNVWAGGDCAYGRDDLTVSAVQDGKVAAIAIDAWLASEGANRG